MQLSFIQPFFVVRQTGKYFLYNGNFKDIKKLEWSNTKKEYTPVSERKLHFKNVQSGK